MPWGWAPTHSPLGLLRWTELNESVGHCMQPSDIKLVPVETHHPADEPKVESQEVYIVPGLEVTGQGCCNGSYRA